MVHEPVTLRLNLPVDITLDRQIPWAGRTSD